MSNEQAQGQTLNEVLIERQGMRLGQMATQIEALTIQLEQAMHLLRENGINFDGTRDVPVPQDNGEVAVV